MILFVCMPQNGYVKAWDQYGVFCSFMKDIYSGVLVMSAKKPDRQQLLQIAVKIYFLK